VAEQLLDLAQVRAGAQELRGEHVSQRVRRYPLPLVDAARGDAVAEDLAELRVVQALTLDADEQRALDERDARRVVLDEERRERGVDRDCPLPPALGPPDPNSRRSRSGSSRRSRSRLPAKWRSHRSRSSRSSSTRKRKNAFSAATVRAWLEAAGRRTTSAARKARKCVVRTSPRSSLPAPCR
jgi:hypothetical protein